MTLGEGSKKLLQKKEFTVIALTVILFVLLSASSEIFLNLYNLDSLQTSVAPNAIIATGMMILLITGVFDLSVGSVMGLSGVVTSLCLVNRVSVPLSILAGLATGAGFGLINGTLVAISGIDPLIATIGTMYVGRGLVNVLLEGSARHGVLGFPESFIMLGAGKTAGIYNILWAMIIVAALAQAITQSTAWGRRLYYCGGNLEGARTAGINVKRIRMITYCLSGLLAALAGILVTARLEMASRALGSGLELKIIISCLIGGGSVSGGQGSIIGALMGCFFMSLVTNSFTIYLIRDFWQNIIIGGLLILVICLDSYLQMRNASNRRRIG